MLIHSEFDIQFQLPAPTAMVAVLHLHPSLAPRLRSGNELIAEHLTTPARDASPLTEHPKTVIPTTSYIDAFGNHCARLFAPVGHLRLAGSNLVDADPYPDTIFADAQQAQIENLPSEVLQFLLPSRYCEVDQFTAIAYDLFGAYSPGWTRATAIRDWVHGKVTFNYNTARPTKTAMDVFTERVGVCRDFQHLAITLSRCLNIPARYVTGYIGDIRMPYSGPGDFSAWYQVFLDGQWINLDARHNYPRLGRILMATGRDAADVAITTSFGSAHLLHFYVNSVEIEDAIHPHAPLPQSTSTEEVAPPDANTPTQSSSSEAGPTQIQSAIL